MQDDAYRFSTDSCAEGLRPDAWNEALAQLLVRASALPPSRPVEGHVSWRRSALGSVFVRIGASPQTWAPLPAGVRSSSLTAFAVLEGAAELDIGHLSRILQAGEVAVLDPAAAWQIRLLRQCRAVAVRLASANFTLRLMRTAAQDMHVITRGTAVGAMCVGAMSTIAESLDQLDVDGLLPVETTLSDLIVHCLSGRPTHAPQDATSVQLGHLRRLCRAVESRLRDAELSLEDVAKREGLSSRYVQKLLKTAGTSFNEYLKDRRLERCRRDLTNPSLDHFTIAQICYRWGFNDAASFSRAFATRYGTSAKAYRANPPRAEPVPRHRGHPLPGEEVASRQAPAKADADTQPMFQQIVRDHAEYFDALALAPKRSAAETGQFSHHYVPASDKTVHWGFLSKNLKPVVTIRSGDVVTLETLTQHATDDRERMVEGDPGAQSVFHWTAQHKAVQRRGAGPMDASIYGRGAGEGFGVHICTGPVYVQEAEPGDVLEVRILDVRHRPSAHPRHKGRIFGSNAAAWWGFQYQDLIEEPKPREVVTLYEIDPQGESPSARAVYSYRWTPQTDPDGVRHDTIDYPGVPVDEGSVYKRYGVLKSACIPLRPHFGVLAVAPKECDLVDSIPPGYFGGNLDNWRAGKGARLFLPVSVPGALFSAGDPHACQGDGEVCGTAIECSLTGVFQLVLHKRDAIVGSYLGDLQHPFLEGEDAWVLQGLSMANHLAELGAKSQAQVYSRSSLDSAMRDAFRKVRHYLMRAHGLDEDEALSLMSVAVDFGVTQVANGNWGVHAVVPKSLFPSESPPQT